MLNKDLEHIIGFDCEMQKNVNKRIEKMIAQKLKDVEAQKSLYIEKITDVPNEKLFSEDTIWEAINLETLAMYELTGVIVGFYAAKKPAVREMLLRGEIDAFDTGKFYVRFRCANGRH